MLGALIGDIVGSTREWHNIKTEDFELLPEGSRVTDDSIMTLAVAKWLMDDHGHSPETLVEIMQDLGRKYPNAGYGGSFRKWLASANPQPYGSFGNGSAMRVSPVGMYAKSLEEALELAKITASVSHNHPEGIKGAQAIAACVYMKMHEKNDVKEKIKQYIEKTFGYDLGIQLEEIRDGYSFDVTCQGSVPIAIMAYLQRDNALDTLRLAISMGGDSDTIGCMATAIADAQPLWFLSRSELPDEITERCRALVPPELMEINDQFEAFVYRPLYQSYYLGQNIFAGEYPGNKFTVKADWKIQQMLHFGVRHFVDLTEEGELNPYAQLLPDNCTYTRFPIPDVSVPESVVDVHRLIQKISELSNRDDGYIYIHCHGGVGRTGTIAACYLAEKMEKTSFEAVMKCLRSRFSNMPKSEYRTTPETKGQEAFVRKYIEGMSERAKQHEKQLKDRVRGSLMAGAAGDALGYPVEFMGRSEIFSRFGKNGITRFELDCNGKALVSDDTQMTLFTANGMLMGVTRGYMRGIGGQPEYYVDGAYLDWYYTQTYKKNSHTGDGDFHYTWLRDLPELAHRRAPGTTCMNACESLLQHEHPQNNSKGCGGIMRVAPMGLFNAVHGFYNPLDLAEAGAKIAKVTHLHPLGYLPAALLALLIERIVPLSPDEVKSTIREIIQDGLDIMAKVEGEQNTAEKEILKNLTNTAIQLADSDTADADAICQLGEGWTGEEAWAISLFCALRHIDSTKEAIIAAVNHDGDSDSTGSITGNIMGAIYGYEAIKEERLFCPEGKSFEETLELHNLILALADDLFTGCIISEYSPIDTPEKRQWYARYCEMKPEGI
ncbi:MAG: ADP-ribosylglycohydrolase family protein [Bacteroidales bacterium]|nr:ADP-ribosylglycohydrolase family protein [Bacteroidales bacterium]